MVLSEKILDVLGSLRSTGVVIGILVTSSPIWVAFVSHLASQHTDSALHSSGNTIRFGLVVLAGFLSLAAILIPRVMLSDPRLVELARPS